MVVPLSHDPGHNDPRSPLYIEPERDRRERLRREREAEAQAEHYRQLAEEHRRRLREAEEVAGRPPTEDELRRLDAERREG